MMSTATAAFQDAVAAGPEMVRQGAVQLAQQNYRVQRQAELVLHDDALSAARKAFEDIKVEAADREFDVLSDDLRQRYQAASAELTRLETQPDGKALRDSLDADLRGADQAYQAAVAQLRTQFGIS